MLVSRELEQAMRGNILGTRTLSLFYATDFADQLENRIIPALRSGFIVLADRYIYTLMARAIVRGVEPAWIQDVYSIALVPDAVFYLTVSPKILSKETSGSMPCSITGSPEWTSIARPTCTPASSNINVRSRKSSKR